MQIDPTIVIAAFGVLTTALGTAARMIYMDLKRDRDFWRDTALKAMGHTDRAIELAAKPKDG